MAEKTKKELRQMLQECNIQQRALINHMEKQEKRIEELKAELADWRNQINFLHNIDNKRS